MAPPKSKNRPIALISKYEKKKIKTPVIDAMENCVFPREIMLCILTRLPVKSLLRFKSVCKPWLNLFSNPKFIRIHHDRLYNDPTKYSFIIYSLSPYYDHTMSLLNNGDKKPKILDHPFPEVFFRTDFVGCCNGLVCMGCPPLGQAIVLWNPALKLFKFVVLSKVVFGVPEQVSLGFGYNAEENDFKVVRIVCLKENKKGKKMGVGVEVYSTRTESWKTIKVSFKFHVNQTKNDTIVNGNPCWVAKVNEKEGVVVWFDVKKDVFEIVPIPNLKLEVGTILHLVDWKGSLAFVLCCKEEKRVKYVELWVLDDAGKVWNKKHSCGPIEMGIYRFLQCSKSGMFLGECPGTKLFLYDLEGKGTEEIIQIDEAQPLSFTNFAYAESLAFIKGMEKVVPKKEDQVEAEDEDEPTPGPSVGAEELLMSYFQLHRGNDGGRRVIF